MGMSFSDVIQNIASNGVLHPRTQDDVNPLATADYNMFANNGSAISPRDARDRMPKEEKNNVGYWGDLMDERASVQESPANMIIRSLELLNNPVPHDARYGDLGGTEYKFDPYTKSYPDANARFKEWEQDVKDLFRNNGYSPTGVPDGMVPYDVAMAFMPQNQTRRQRHPSVVATPDAISRDLAARSSQPIPATYEIYGNFPNGPRKITPSYDDILADTYKYLGVNPIPEKSIPKYEPSKGVKRDV